MLTVLSNISEESSLIIKNLDLIFDLLIALSCIVVPVTLYVSAINLREAGKNRRKQNHDKEGGASC
jgi:hypothetical protein